MTTVQHGWHLFVEPHPGTIKRGASTICSGCSVLYLFERLFPTCQECLESQEQGFLFLAKKWRAPKTDRYLEMRHVVLSEGSGRVAARSFAQDDTPDLSYICSREFLSPNICKTDLLIVSWFACMLYFSGLGNSG